MSIVPAQNFYRPISESDLETLFPTETVEALKRKKNLIFIQNNDSPDKIFRVVKENYYLSQQITEILFQGCHISNEQMCELAEMTNISGVVFGSSTLPTGGIHLLSRMKLGSLGLVYSQLNEKMSELANSGIKKLILGRCGEQNEDMEILAKGGFEEIIVADADNITLQGIQTLVAGTTITSLGIDETLKKWKPSEKLEIAETLARNTMLVRLSVGHNQLDFNVACKLAKSETLQYLNFSGNQEGGREDRIVAFQALADNRNLQSLIIKECRINDEDLIVLSQNRSLTSLIIRCNHLITSCRAIEAFANHPTITELDFTGFYLSHKINFNNFAQLRSLSVEGLFGGSRPHGKAIAESLATLPNLTSLSVGYIEEEIEVFAKAHHTTLTTFKCVPSSSNSNRNDAMKRMDEKTTRVRRVVHNWQRVCFLLAFYRANNRHCLRNSVLHVVRDVMSFSGDSPRSMFETLFEGESLIY